MPISKYRIAIIIFYFGKWPEWFELFVESVKRNKSIDFHFFTDCNTEELNGDNIFIHKISFLSYCEKISMKLNFDFRPKNGLKLCDIRPMLGVIHEDIFSKYDFYGWTDVDLLFGDIREFYTDEILARYEVFSTHSTRISGHLALFKNNSQNRTKYLSIYDWKKAVQNPEFVGIDEHGITNAYTMTVFD